MGNSWSGESKGKVGGQGEDGTGGGEAGRWVALEALSRVT